MGEFEKSSKIFVPRDLAFSIIARRLASTVQSQLLEWGSALAPSSQ